MHLTIDGYGGDYQQLSDLDFIFDLLDDCPDRIGMTKIMPPYVFKYHGKVPTDWGISGFVLIAESHISVHTFPDRAHVSVDIFSCKEFDTDAAIQQIKAAFGLATVECRILERGLEYPHDPTLAAELIHVERHALAQAGGHGSLPR